MTADTHSRLTGVTEDRESSLADTPGLPPAGVLRSYLLIPGEPIEVKASSPFEAAKALREKYPEFGERSVSVVARSLVWEHDGKRWWK